jgi:DNA-binding cell septation regulator SpoVG
MRSLMIVFLPLGIFLAAISEIKAEHVAVTNVKETAEIILNGFLKIRGIEVETKGKETELKLPDAKAPRSGRVWTQIKIIDKNLEKAIIDAIKTGKVSKTSKGKPSYKIDDLIIVTKDTSYYEGPGELKAVAWVTFDNAISVKCKYIEIQREQMRYIVGWPGQLIEYNYFMPTVSILDKKLKKDIERDFIKKYKSQIMKKQA